MLYTIIFKLYYWLFLVLFLWIDDPRTMEEDALILKVIEAYCTSAKTRHTVNSCKYWGMVTSGGHQGVGVVMCNVCSFSVGLLFMFIHVDWCTDKWYYCQLLPLLFQMVFFYHSMFAWIFEWVFYKMIELLINQWVSKL